VTFIDVTKNSSNSPLEVEPGVTVGDYLFGFLYGTRQALSEKGRENLTITIRELNANSVGQLIALYERAVGFYASLVNINAYHQPGVEAGKKAAQSLLELQGCILETLHGMPGSALTADEVAGELNTAGDAESIYHLLCHLAARQAVEQVGFGPQASFRIA
jgi:glucose-6-phosphate isomerase